MTNANISFAQDSNSGDGRWLMLIAQLPSGSDYVRVKLHRRLQRIGAFSLKGAVYVLPNRSGTAEDFAWLRTELIGDGGEAIICTVAPIAGFTDAELEQRFRDLRDADYRAIAADASAAMDLRSRDELAREIARLRKRLGDVEKVDFFDAAAGPEARGALADLESRAKSFSNSPMQTATPAPRPQVWVTRTGVFVDRIASAWLVRRFIDAAATFKFVSGPSYEPQAAEVRFDMFDAEFTHEGEKCTFEVLLERFALDDSALRAIGEIVHDIDCKDAKFERAEAAGVELVLSGLARSEPSDAMRIERGSAIFDGLYAQLSGARP